MTDPGTKTTNNDDNKNDEEIVIQKGDLSTLVKQSDGSFRIDLITGKGDSSPKAVLKFALKRLAHDLFECRNNPLPMIAAEPLNEDTNMWYELLYRCNILLL